MTYTEKYDYVADCITNGAASADEYDIDAIIDDLCAYGDLNQVPYDEFWSAVENNER